MKKAEAKKTLGIIVDTIKEATQNGSFGNFTADPNSITGESESY